MTELSIHIRKLAAVSYIPLLGPIVWYGHKKNEFIRWHALQGTTLSIYLVVAYFIPLVGPYLALGFGALAATAFIHAIHGENYKIPVLGHFLELII